MTFPLSASLSNIFFAARQPNHVGMNRTSSADFTWLNIPNEHPPAGRRTTMKKNVSSTNTSTIRSFRVGAMRQVRIPISTSDASHFGERKRTVEPASSQRGRRRIQLNNHIWSVAAPNLTDERRDRHQCSLSECCPRLAYLHCSYGSSCWTKDKVS